MHRILLIFAFITLTSAVAFGQEPITVQKDSSGKASAKVDTLEAKYVNIGKIEARRSMIRSAMIPGWGQISNGITVYRIAKVAAIYTGGTLLAMSFIQNNRDYKETLRELQYRQVNNDRPNPSPDNIYIEASTPQLTQAKEIFRRNKEVVIFSFVALYGVNVIEAYIDARLKYFDINNELAMKISPGAISSGSMYGYSSFTPAIKLSFKL
jgi:hypothetical protein